MLNPNKPTLPLVDRMWVLTAGPDWRGLEYNVYSPTIRVTCLETGEIVKDDFNTWVDGVTYCAEHFGALNEGWFIP